MKKISFIAAAAILAISTLARAQDEARNPPPPIPVLSIGHIWCGDYNDDTDFGHINVLFLSQRNTTFRALYVTVSQQEPKNTFGTLNGTVLRNQRFNATMRPDFGLSKLRLARFADR
jgi:hypothetical protein